MKKALIIIGILLSFFLFIGAKYWFQYAFLGPGNINSLDNFLIRDMSDPTDNAVEGTVKQYRYLSLLSDLSGEFIEIDDPRCFSVTVVYPQDLLDPQRDLFPIWSNNTGSTFTISGIRSWSDTDDTHFAVEVVSEFNWAAPTTVDDITISTNGTSIYYNVQTVITDPTIADGEIVTLDFDNTDDPGFVMVEICGSF